MLDEADHMADLGFLPAVRRLLDQTPRGGQRLLFSATLDKAIDVLVKRFLDQPVVHEADSAQSPVSAMDHHVLHVCAASTGSPSSSTSPSAPGRTIVFTRTKHGAKALARQLNKSGVPAVDLHGNLSQGARTRNLEAFHCGTATTLVATDIAARGIHVDDVALVVHADPPAEHKAYLHRSGRTARAGAAGTVITLMTDEQVRDVRDLTRAAGSEADHHQARQRQPPGAAGARPRRAPHSRAGSSPRPATAPSRPRGSGGGGTGSRSRKPWRPARRCRAWRRRERQPQRRAEARGGNSSGVVARRTRLAAAAGTAPRRSPAGARPSALWVVGR